MARKRAAAPITPVEVVRSLYRDPISVGDLQTALLASQSEVEGKTPPKDQKIQDLVYNYLQVNKSRLSPEQISSFSATLAWICVGKELTKFLALVPNASLESVLSAAKKSGFDVEVSG